MTKKHSTKRALVASILTLCLCFTALVGTTFAWFTDSVTSANNVIKTGNLDIKAEYTLDGETWKAFDGASDLFQKGAWEPGHTEVVAIKITNAGSLALKYKVNMNIVEEIVGKSVQGNDIILSDILTVDSIIMDTGAMGDVLLGVAFSDESTLQYTNTASFKNANVLGSDEMLLPDTSKYLIIKVDMPETVGNEANHDGTNKPSIEFGIDILATQFTSENDSFDNQYDFDANYVTSVSTLDEFFKAIDNGDDVLLNEPIVVNDDLISYMNERYSAAAYALGRGTQVIDNNVIIDGNGSTVYRTEEMADKSLFTVTTGCTLTLSNITLDGGAKWTGATDPTLLRGTENSGMKTSGTLILASIGAHIVLEEGAVLQNNDGANAITLERNANGSSLTVNGGEIINNTSAAGAIYNGGKITINSGKLNGNHATSIGGAIRMLNNSAGGTISFTMNGGEINHNKSDTTGGAIWGGNNAKYTFNGGEMAYNFSQSGGGAIWTGTYETYVISGDFELHDNSSNDLGGAIRFCDHSSLTMTGGKVYNNTVNGNDSAFYLLNNSATITGGEISDNFSYAGGLGLTMGEVDMSGVVSFDLSTNHNTAYLALEFSELKFTVNEADEHFVNFNFKPATGYTYTEGDEDKLVCLNEGYETYWDATTSTFRLRATND